MRVQSRDLDTGGGHCWSGICAWDVNDDRFIIINILLPLLLLL